MNTMPNYVMVLVYQPELTRSVWIDYFTRRRSLKTLIKELQAAIKKGHGGEDIVAAFDWLPHAEEL
jgi:DNA-binding winged helix-turn-helix (wHTH) protein